MSDGSADDCPVSTPPPTGWCRGHVLQRVRGAVADAQAHLPDVSQPMLQTIVAPPAPRQAGGDRFVLVRMAFREDDDDAHPGITLAAPLARVTRPRRARLAYRSGLRRRRHHAHQLDPGRRPSTAVPLEVARRSGCPSPSACAAPAIACSACIAWEGVEPEKSRPGVVSSRLVSRALTGLESGSSSSSPRATATASTAARALPGGHRGRDARDGDDGELGRAQRGEGRDEGAPLARDRARRRAADVVGGRRACRSSTGTPLPSPLALHEGFSRPLARVAAHGPHGDARGEDDHGHNPAVGGRRRRRRCVALADDSFQAFLEVVRIRHFLWCRNK